MDHLIVGSGLAGVATAMALHRAGRRFEVLDVGFDLEEHEAEEVRRLSLEPPEVLRRAGSTRLFGRVDATIRGVHRRRAFGSDFPYRVPSSLEVHTEDCETELSHGFGGFGNVWGATMLPYSAEDLHDWPVPRDELEHSYSNVLRYVPLSAVEDDLASTHPLHTNGASALERSPQADALLGALRRRKEALAARGITFGRARLAVDSSGSERSCRYCGLCLEGCVYGSIFNPRSLWRVLEDRYRIHRGTYVMELAESEDHVVVTAVSVHGGCVRQWRARRVFLAAGHLATTRILARSLGRLHEPIRVLDSQYFFFPFLTYRSLPHEPKFELADVFLEIQDRALSTHPVHFQVYGMRPVFQQALRGLLPRPLPISFLTGRMYLFQGYLPSGDSGSLELEVGRAGRTADRVWVRGVRNQRATEVSRKARALLCRNLRSFGLSPPGSSRLVPPGRSFHGGGSFPMGGTHRVFSSDDLGRPAGLRRVHIVDSACFPSIASSTIGFTIMANADRITRRQAALLPE